MKKPIIILVFLLNSFISLSQTTWEKSDTILIQACYYKPTEITVSILQDSVFDEDFWINIISEQEIVVPEDLIRLLKDYDFNPVSVEYNTETDAVVFVFRKIRIESEIRYGENIK